MARKSLSSEASSALFRLSTFNERYFSLKDTDSRAAADLMEKMIVMFDKQVMPYLQPYLPENEAVRRQIEKYQKLVRN